MKKIVYNACYGGFGLSAHAVKRYAELCGRQCYFFANKKNGTHTDLDSFEEVSVDEADSRYIFYAYDTREGIDWLKSERGWRDWTEAARRAHNEKCNQHYIESGRELKRDDPILVRVVEELGDKANGHHADLRIATVPSGTKYRIDEYDGTERVMTIDDYEWETA